MFEFIAQRLSHVPGVNRTETSVCMRVVKKSHQWSTDLTSTVASGGRDEADVEDVAETADLPTEREAVTA